MTHVSYDDETQHTPNEKSATNTLMEEFNEWREREQINRVGMTMSSAIKLLEAGVDEMEVARIGLMNRALVADSLDASMGCLTGLVKHFKDRELAPAVQAVTNAVAVLVARLQAVDEKYGTEFCKSFKVSAIEENNRRVAQMCAEVE